MSNKIRNEFVNELLTEIDRLREVNISYIKLLQERQEEIDELRRYKSAALTEMFRLKEVNEVYIKTIKDLQDK